jgi:SulP family sulfate permease
MGEWHEFARLRHFKLPYRSVLLGTFFLTVVFDLTIAVEVGLLLACGFFIWRMSQLFQVEPVSAEVGPATGAATGAATDDFQDTLPEPTPGVEVFSLYGTLFFGAVGKVETLPERLRPDTQVLVLEMHRLISIDTSGVDALTQLHRQLQRRGVSLIMATLNEQPHSLLTRSGFETLLGAHGIAPTLAAALEAAHRHARPVSHPPAGSTPAA